MKQTLIDKLNANDFTLPPVSDETITVTRSNDDVVMDLVLHVHQDEVIYVSVNKSEKHRITATRQTLLGFSILPTHVKTIEPFRFGAIQKQFKVLDPEHYIDLMTEVTDPETIYDTVASVFSQLRTIE